MGVDTTITWGVGYVFTPEDIKRIMSRFDPDDYYGAHEAFELAVQDLNKRFGDGEMLSFGTFGSYYSEMTDDNPQFALLIDSVSGSENTRYVEGLFVQGNELTPTDDELVAFISALQDLGVSEELWDRVGFLCGVLWH